jgi:hypothetical protein
MLEIYQGILRGSHIEWRGDVPPQLPSDQAVRVHVTLLERVTVASPQTSQGQRMAAALERSAALPALEEISDPAAWERETRQDRPLPGKDA